MGRSNEPYVVLMELQKDIFEPPVTKSKKTLKRQKVEEFLKAATALMNVGRGLVCIHTQIGHFLGLFDEQIDSKLNTMIPDGSLFHENFERYFEDNDHVFFRVQPRERGMVSLSSNTKVSLNVGIVEPSHHQLKMFLEKVSRVVTVGNQPSPAAEPRQNSMAFELGEEVAISPGVFQENCRVQAKSILEKLRLRDPSNPGRVQQLADYMWKEVSLPSYISAFSKVVGGGMVLYGVGEEKRHVEYKWKKVQSVGPSMPFTLPEPSKWSAWEDANPRPVAGPSYLILKTDSAPANPARQAGQASSTLWQLVDPSHVTDIVSITHPDWRIWEDASDHRVYHVAKDRDVPVLQQSNTGRFLCEGVALDEAERTSLSEELVRRVENEMYWLGHDRPQDPVIFTFHRLEPAGNMWVLEVRVPQYHGLAFYHKDGPHAFKVNSKSEVVPISAIGQWVSGFLKGSSSLLPSASPSVSHTDCQHKHLSKQTPLFTEVRELIRIQ